MVRSWWYLFSFQEEASRPVGLRPFPRPYGFVIRFFGYLDVSGTWWHRLSWSRLVSAWLCRLRWSTWQGVEPYKESTAPPFSEEGNSWEHRVSWDRWSGTTHISRILRTHLILLDPIVVYRLSVCHWVRTKSLRVRFLDPMRDQSPNLHTSEICTQPGLLTMPKSSVSTQHFWSFGLTLLTLLKLGGFRTA